MQQDDWVAIAGLDPMPRYVVHRFRTVGKFRFSHHTCLTGRSPPKHRAGPHEDAPILLARRPEFSLEQPYRYSP